MDISQMESIITTQLKVRVPKLTNNNFPNMSFSNEISDQTPSFPNVFIQELEPTELGMDLENNSIHAIRDTIQVSVSTNTTKADARTVTNACMAALKALRYTVFMLPIYTKDNNIHRFVLRARRVVGAGDTF